MKLAWTEGLSAEDKKAVKEDYQKSAAIRKRLVTMLDKRIDAEVKGITAKNRYDNPNWALLQADSIGYQRALNEIIALLTN